MTSLSLSLSLVAQTIKNLPAMRETQVQSLGFEDPPGKGNGNPLQYSCLGNLMDRGVWWDSPQGCKRAGHDSATATAAVKSLQSCPTLCDPTDALPQGSPDAGILHARTLEWGAIAFSETTAQLHSSHILVK